MMERQLGRESQKDNDLFYTCSLIDYIARKTKNKKSSSGRCIRQRMHCKNI